MSACRAAFELIDQAEAARVVEAQDRAVVERQDHMVVLLRRKIGSRGRNPPRHAEMHQQEPGFVELDEDIFAAPRQPSDARALEPGREHRWEWAPQVRAAQLGPHDLSPAYAKRAAAAEG